MARTATVKTHFTLGEVSPRVFGRFDEGKPIWQSSAAILENFLISQSGGIMFWPGTRFVCAAKYSNRKTYLASFAYSRTQQYLLELGDYYMRFISVVGGVVGQVVVPSAPTWTTPTAYTKGQYVTNGGVIYYCLISHTSGVFATDLANGDWVAQNILEVPTPWAVADVPALEFANKEDVMYITHGNYFPQKLIRTTTTSFTLSNVPFVRGPFLDSNITSTTITPSSATGNTTLTASTSIFQSGHVGTLFRIQSAATVGACVLITGYTSGTVVTGVVQAEPDGTAGNIGGTGAYTNWSEGAFSSVRGYPLALTFFEGRLLYSGAMFQPQKWYASVVGAYDNFNVGTGIDPTAVTDSSSYSYEIDSNSGAAIRWMDIDTNLKMGTSSGTLSAVSPATGTTPSNAPQIIHDTDYAAMQQQPAHIGGYLYFLQSNSYQLRQLIYDLVISRDKAEDMTLLADHILRDGGGGVQIGRQQSPNDRIWVPRVDGQMAVFTRNVEQSVQGWSRRTAGFSAMGPGLFESVCVLPQDGTDDLVFVTVNRNINGSAVQYIEYFTPELSQYDWEPVRVDCSLSFNNPITITNITNASPGVVTAPSHGFSSGDQVKIDNVIGMTQLNYQHFLVVKLSADTFSLTQLDGTAVSTLAYGKYWSGGQVRKMVKTLSGLTHLNGETVVVQTDGFIPAAQQSFVVANGQITLPNPAAVVHVGLPYYGTCQFLPLGQEATQGRSRKPYITMLRVWKSAGGSFGKDVNSQVPIQYPNQTPNVNPPTASVLYTGDVEVDYESVYAKDWQPVIMQTKPLPFYCMAAVITEDLQADK